HATRHDLRFWNADRNAVVIGPDLLLDTHDGVVRVGADKKSRRYQYAIVLGLTVNMLDALDPFDDGLERVCDQFDRVRRTKTVGAHADIHQRHGNLRLFLTRDREERQEPDRQRGEQKKRRERRADRALGQCAGNAKIHRWRSGGTMASPGSRPERISTPSGVSSVGAAPPRCTGAS